MTQPTIVITIEGGVVAGISASHQATVIVVDYDTQGIAHDLHNVGGSDAVVFSQDVFPENECWIAEVLESLK